MFLLEVEKQGFGMKPMNCPGHCIMFKSSIRSYRDLPMRYADFGVLHRNELSGALSGLTRVRRFQQDDAHIFCRQDQISAEVSGALDFMKTIYGIFGFSFEVQLSTRPEKYMGEIALWEKAERALAQCLDQFGGEWTINANDGAFYGPKIDIQVTDALKRKHQCATIQLDFQLPINFELEYKTETGFERPVIVHRAILGSCERMFAILIEHYGGKWPFWLSPRQAMVTPVGQGFIEYGKQVAQAIHDAGFFCDVDTTKKQLPKKIAEAQAQNYNFILVVGPSEKDNGTVTVRRRDTSNAKDQVTLTVDQLLAYFRQLDAAKY
jgi:threonyl-tRNA synthetase